MSFAGSYVPSVTPPTRQDQPAWWFLFRGYRLLVQDGDTGVSLPHVRDLPELNLTALRRQYLGSLNGSHCYSAELSEDSEAPSGWRFEGLRRLYGRLPEDLFRVAGAAVQIVDWDRTHQYCGRCGVQTRDKEHERAKECPQCGLLSYPRISPAIIVLIEKGNRCLICP